MTHSRPTPRMHGPVVRMALQGALLSGLLLGCSGATTQPLAEEPTSPSADQNTSQADAEVSGVTATPSTQEQAMPEDKQADTKAQGGKPFMFNEAKLPVGYPPPGPVGQVMVKTYPAYRAAIVREDSSSGRNMDNAFGKLFNHIKQNQIAMTAPVEMQYQPATPSDAANEQTQGRFVNMMFLYRDPQMGQVGPQGEVEVIDVPAQMVVSIGVRGGYREKNVQEPLAKLQAWLETHADQYRVAGPPRYLGYNSPFVPSFLRFSEVQIPVERVE